MSSEKISPYCKLASLFLSIFLILAGLGTVSYAQVPKPSNTFGFQPGATHKLALYNQMLDYYHQLAAASDRVKEIDIGNSVLGRPMKVLIISSKNNLKQLERWRSISQKMARAQISDQQAKKFSRQGKAIVWIDMGLHANEMATAQMAPALMYKLATKETPEFNKIRKNVVALIAPEINPDGLDIMGSWYLNHIGTPYETTSPPWLWHYYAGHDNNRDWFMNNLPETRHVTKILYRTWFPQIIYNHHQSAPAWTRISIPPYSGPVNQKIPPAVTAEVNEVGAAMQQRFASKDMPGAVARNYFTMFWNGGDRTVPYYHNQAGILTETAQPLPTPSYFDPDSLPKYVANRIPTDSTAVFYPYPWPGGKSTFGDAINYSLTASVAALDLAAQKKTSFLYNFYRMGRQSIEKGKEGDPYAYIIPQKQWDEWEAKNLVNILFRGGLEVKQATNNFSAGGKMYAAGSYVLYAGQSFRPYLMDLLEPQHYPKRRQYPGGPPKKPYDLTGWTLPLQMGVRVKRIDSSFEVSTKDIVAPVKPSASAMEGQAKRGYVISAKSNAAVKVVNKLLDEGGEISRTTSKITVNEHSVAPGAYIVSDANRDSLKKMSARYGITVEGLSSKPEAKTEKITRPNIGLYKSWIPNKDEGWTRWLLKSQYHFWVDSLHDGNVRQRDLSQYSSIILPSQRASSIQNGFSVQQMPKKYTGGLGLEGTSALEQYVKNGGTLIAFDEASDFVIQQFGLPVSNAVRGVSDDRFFIPGSLIRTIINTDDPLAFGMQDTVAVAFERSRAFEIAGQRQRMFGGGKVHIKKTPETQVDVVARYAKSDLLMSGYALGAKKYISGKPAMVRVPVGKGQVILFAFRPQFRGQPRGTYKLIFNALYNSTMDAYPSKSKAAK